MFDFIHWFATDARAWVTETARSHPYWAFPIALVIAFSESFVGVSFVIPGTFLLITLGGVIGASHISLFPAWLGAVMGKITVLAAIILFLQWRPAGIFAARGRGLED